ncbi:hypothetical protein K469DRAFT_728677 [Zopfia rhizophila CBS 207.26]|uniref:GPI inositol-deacylase winged helix domain-containing protein n=1 Tax=Zopfia rhizophila CBS 207.26 TaxID=1314779 RepID=A0A6A6EQW6_9PEZI|nr:hypothetical protein K469DRAFT_728677 [Zopfia rhizophila CBS 207.26]
METVEDTYIVLDALDECHLLGLKQRNIHLLVTSRLEQDIKIGLSDLAYDETAIPVEGGLISDDICRYVRARVKESDDLKRWRSYPDIDALENCLDYRTLKETLASLLKTLDETYSRILHAIPSEHKKYATMILQLVTFSERPLRIEEAVDAIVVDTEGDPYFSLKYRMPDPQEISRYCSSLVAVVSMTECSDGEDSERVELQLAHFSVKEYLTSNRLDSGIAQDFQESTARAAIAKACLAYLLHFDREIPLKEVVQGFPFARYSAEFWMTNAVVAGDKDKRVLDFIEQLFYYQKSSYKICYSLYRPDRPWDNTLYEPRDRPASALYYAALGGLLHTVKCLLNRSGFS